MIMLENSYLVISLFVWNVFLAKWKSSEFMQAHIFVFMIYLVIKSKKLGTCLCFYALSLILYNISFDVTFTSTELKLDLFII